ncbi:MAG: glycosyltransferase family 39 protein [bacterium]
MFFIILGLLFRIIHLQSIEKNDPTFYSLPSGTDMVTYDAQAQDILKGKHPAPYYYCPLYSYFLSFIYFFFGHNLYIARLIQMLLGVFTCLFIYFIANIVFGSRIALISLFLSIIYDMFLIHEGLILLESFSVFLNTASLFFILRLEKERKLKNIILSGLFLGLSALTRATALFFLPFILLWMLKSSRLKASGSRLIRFAFLCLITFLTISPATIMNYIASKKFILISTNGPVNLWIGNNEKANGRYLQPLPSHNLEKRLEEIGDRAYIEEVLRFIKEKPKKFIALLLTKFFFFWDNYEDINNVNYGQVKGYSPLLKLPFFIGFGVIAPLAFLGICLSFRRNALLLHLFFLSYIIILIAFFVTGRHRLVVVPVMVIFSSFAISWIYDKVKEAEYKKLAFSFFPLLLGIILGWKNDIYANFVPIIYQDGFHIKEEKEITIKDTSEEWRGQNCLVLNRGTKCKKEIVIEEDLLKFKEISLKFKYGTLPNTIVELKINESPSSAIDFPYTKGLINPYTCFVDKGILKNGVNSFVFEVKEGTLAIPYDTTYTFGRSYEFRDGDFKKIKKGEFLVELSLKK